MALSKPPQMHEAFPDADTGKIAQFMLNALSDSDRKRLLDLLLKLDDFAGSSSSSDAKDRTVGSIRNLLTKAFQQLMETRTYEDSRYGMIA
jgi:hypothetical protein